MYGPKEVGDTELDEILLSRDPGRTFTPDQGRIRSIASAARMSAPQGHGPRPLVAWISVGLAAVVGFSFAAPAVADAVQQLSHTGRFAPPTTESDESEWISSEGSDYGTYLFSIFPTWITVPDGISLNAFRAKSVELLSAVEGEGQQLLFESTFENDARCVWAADWLRATEGGDSAGALAAADVLRASTEWPATLGVADSQGSYIAYLESVAQAAETGSTTIIGDFVATNCSPELIELAS